MASGAVGRKTTNHYSSTSAGNLDNNLDALLDDLQTSIGSKNAVNSTPPQRSSSRQERIIETTTSRHSPLRSASPMRSISPSTGARTTTLEKYVSTGPAGTPSGIPGLEMLDKELQDVQPGQSKTVAYKQVSYHYDRQQEGQNLEPWTKTSKITKNDASIVDDFCERTFEKSSSSSRPARDSPDFAKTNKEIIYKADVSTKNIPVATTTTTTSKERDFKYLKETSSYREPSPITSRKKTIRTDETEELTNLEYIPRSSPIPASLAPGPNTKVTKTVKTYTYELPGAPETYTTLHNTTHNTSSSSLTRNVNVDKTTSSYVSSLPRDTEKTISYHVEEQRANYVPPSPSTSRVHREEKVYVDRRIYRAASPPPPLSTTSTVSRSERYLQQSVPDYPVGPSPSSTTSRTEQRVIYQSEQPQPPPPETHQRTTVKQYEEHFSASRPPPRPYYPPETNHNSSTTVYKYDEQQSMLPTRPFPTSERTSSPRQQPPKRIEDLMASFSDTEEVMEVRHERKTTSTPKKEVDFVPHTPPVVRSKNVAGPPVYYPPGAGEFSSKKEISMVTSGGGGEFSKKEESMAAMSKSSGGWAKERAAWEYGASSKSEEKTKTKKAVVPVCLPLCCALPCVIM